VRPYCWKDKCKSYIYLCVMKNGAVGEFRSLRGCAETREEGSNVPSPVTMCSHTFYKHVGSQELIGEKKI